MTLSHAPAHRGSRYGRIPGSDPQALHQTTGRSLLNEANKAIRVRRVKLVQASHGVERGLQQQHMSQPTSSGTRVSSGSRRQTTRTASLPRRQRIGRHSQGTASIGQVYGAAPQHTRSVTSSHMTGGLGLRLQRTRTSRRQQPSYSGIYLRRRGTRATRETRVKLDPPGRGLHGGGTGQPGRHMPFEISSRTMDQLGSQPRQDRATSRPDLARAGICTLRREPPDQASIGKEPGRALQRTRATILFRTEAARGSRRGRRRTADRAEHRGSGICTQSAARRATRVTPATRGQSTGGAASGRIRRATASTISSGTRATHMSQRRQIQGKRLQIADDRQQSRDREPPAIRM